MRLAIINIIRIKMRGSRLGLLVECSTTSPVNVYNISRQIRIIVSDAHRRLENSIPKPQDSFNQFEGGSIGKRACVCLMVSYGPPFSLRSMALLALSEAKNDRRGKRRVSCRRMRGAIHCDGG